MSHSMTYQEAKALVDRIPADDDAAASIDVVCIIALARPHMSDQALGAELRRQLEAIRLVFKDRDRENSVECMDGRSA